MGHFHSISEPYGNPYSWLQASHSHTLNVAMPLYHFTIITNSSYLVDKYSFDADGVAAFLIFAIFKILLFRQFYIFECHKCK